MSSFGIAGNAACSAAAAFLLLLGIASPLGHHAMPHTQNSRQTLRAVITHRYYVLAQYTRSLRQACRQEIDRLTQLAAVRSGEGIDAASANKLLRWLRLHTWDRRARQPLTLDPVLHKDHLLQTVYSMRQELSGLWSRSGVTRSATAEQTLKQLCDWRARAETSGIVALREFARRLPH